MMEMHYHCWCRGNYTSVPEHILQHIKDIFSSFNSTKFCEDAIHDIRQVETRDQNNKAVNGTHKWAVCIESPRLSTAGRPQVQPSANDIGPARSQNISFQAAPANDPMVISDLMHRTKWDTANSQTIMGIPGETALLMHMDNKKLWDLAGNCWHHHFLRLGSVYKATEQGPGSNGSSCTGPLLCLGSIGNDGAALAWPLTSVTWTVPSTGSASSHQQPIQHEAFELSMCPVNTGHLSWIFALDWKDLVAIPTKVVCPASLQHLGLHASSHTPAIMLMKVQPPAALANGCTCDTNTHND
jgi:hypothetical protein